MLSITKTFAACRTACAVAALGLLSATASQAQQGVGIKPVDIDPSVSPCTDFFQYASGGWMKNNPVPGTDGSWGSFDVLAQHNYAIMRSILEESARNAPKAAKGSNVQKVGDFYGSAMDSVAIEKAGLKYLRPHLARIEAVADLAGMQRLVAGANWALGDVWFENSVTQDEKNSAKYVVYFYQSGLTLPNRDYYLNQDAPSQRIRAAYHTYLVNVFKLLGEPQATATAHAAAVQRIETRLATASKRPEDLRDPLANYHKLTVAQATAQFPNLNVPLLLQKQGLASATDVVVYQPDFLKEVSTMLKAEPLADQKTYVRWHLVSHLMDALPAAFGQEQFAFQRVMRGTTIRKPRWKRMLRSTDDALGEAFGQLYVDKTFSPETKARARQLIENLRQAYAERIQATDWMSAATKAEALKKLNAIAVKVGYPDKWKDYSALPVSRESYLNNLLAARVWEHEYNVRKFGKPVDRSEWLMTPPTVNAFYSANKNDITFSAGILQPPFFDPNADDAVNYGGIGAVIGHEMTHGFDDQGRQYDAQGNLRDWWTKEDGERFNARAAVVGKQFDAFSPLDSVHVNGKLTMGENLADLGGLTIAYQAFEKTAQAKAGQKIDGFTPEQRFFLGYAQIWRSNSRPEAVRQQVQTDPHAPDQFRTIGPLMNMPEFYQAFGCKPGDAMTLPPAEQGRIW